MSEHLHVFILSVLVTHTPDLGQVDFVIIQLVLHLLFSVMLV